MYYDNDNSPLIHAYDDSYEVLPHNELETRTYPKKEIDEPLLGIQSAINAFMIYSKQLEETAPEIYADVMREVSFLDTMNDNMRYVYQSLCEYIASLQRSHATIPPREDRLNLELLGFTLDDVGFPLYTRTIVNQYHLEITEEVIIAPEKTHTPFIHRKRTICYTVTSTGKTAGRDDISYEDMETDNELLTAIKNTAKEIGKPF